MYLWNIWLHISHLCVTKHYLSINILTLTCFRIQSFKSGGQFGSGSRNKMATVCFVERSWSQDGGDWIQMCPMPFLVYIFRLFLFCGRNTIPQGKETRTCRRQTYSTLIPCIEGKYQKIYNLWEFIRRTCERSNHLVWGVAPRGKAPTLCLAHGAKAYVSHDCKLLVVFFYNSKLDNTPSSMWCEYPFWTNYYYKLNKGNIYMNLMCNIAKQCSPIKNLTSM